MSKSGFMNSLTAVHNMEKSKLEGLWKQFTCDLFCMVLRSEEVLGEHRLSYEETMKCLEEVDELYEYFDQIFQKYGESEIQRDRYQRALEEAADGHPIPSFEDKYPELAVSDWTTPVHKQHVHNKRKKR